jgi:hypothetical protein
MTRSEITGAVGLALDRLGPPFGSSIVVVDLDDGGGEGGAWEGCAPVEDCVLPGTAMEHVRCDGQGGLADLFGGHPGGRRCGPVDLILDAGDAFQEFEKILKRQQSGVYCDLLKEEQQQGCE